MIKLGNNDISTIGQMYLGSSTVTKAYLGGEQIYPSVPVTKYVQDLINEGYANVVTGNGGSYIEIHSNTPYAMSQILDLEEVALNEKKLVEGVNNTILWDDTLPNGWSGPQIYAMYDGKTMNYTPRARMFWGIIDVVNDFTITFPSASWSVNDYPWGSGSNNDGIFAPRYNTNREQEYGEKHFRATPKNVTVNFPGHFSSIGQTMFAQMEQTTTLNLNCCTTGDIWSNLWECHDVTAMFERCYGLETLNITGTFSWWAIRTCHNMFRQCNSLTGIPYSSIFGARDHTQNILYPRYDGTRGSAECAGLFNATSLEYIGPVLNMNAVSLTGCVADGYNQSALGSSYEPSERPTAYLFNCPVLTDVRIINLNNNDWNFNDTSTLTYIPNMDVASIEYILNNVADCSSDPHTVTFSTLHQGEISLTAIDNAKAKGWTIDYQP